MPFSIAANVGAWRTNQQTNVAGIFGQARMLPVIVANLYFPSLNNVGGQFAFAMDDMEQELIVGIDILNPLGITIDTRTQQLSVRNEIWEAFKILAGVGVLVFGGLKVLEALSKRDDKTNKETGHKL
jgi:hypothetical protein